MKKQHNKFSHLTAIERTYLSFPAKQLLDKNLLKGKILDFGCGFGNDVKLLQQKGFDVKAYDPYYFPEYPDNKFDTIICFYVLNVLFPEEQANVLMEVSHLLNSQEQICFSQRVSSPQVDAVEVFHGKSPPRRRGVSQRDISL